MNKEKLLINNEESNNSKVKSNKPYIVTNPEIEKMAEVIKATEKIALDAHCGYPSPRMYATDLYRKGYRKQAEGEWLQDFDGDCYCPFCARYPKEILNFCPECGAKMKGE